MNDSWFEWAHRLEAEAMNGLAYPNDGKEFSFHREHYERIREVAAEMKAAALAGLADGDGRTAEEAALEAKLKNPLMEFQQKLLDGKYGNYLTPKVDVRGVVFNEEGKILLVRELNDPNRGYTLPGGWVDVCDLPKEGAVREVWEETGFETRAVKLLALWVNYLHGHPEDPRFRIYKIFVRCEIVGGSAKDSNETEAPAFFAEDEVDALTLSLPRTTHAELHRLFEHYRNPDLPTDCD